MYTNDTYVAWSYMHVYMGMYGYIHAILENRPITAVRFSEYKTTWKGVSTRYSLVQVRFISSSQGTKDRSKRDWLKAFEIPQTPEIREDLIVNSSEPKVFEFSSSTINWSLLWSQPSYLSMKSNKNDYQLPHQSNQVTHSGEHTLLTCVTELLQ